MLAAMAALACIALPSCSDDDDESQIGSKSDLIGLWESTHVTGWEKENGTIVDRWDEYGVDMRIELRADGSCTLWEWDDSQWGEAQNGYYSYSNGVLSMNGYDWDSPDVYNVKKLTATELELEASDSYWSGETRYELYNDITFRKVTN